MAYENLGTNVQAEVKDGKLHLIVDLAGKGARTGGGALVLADDYGYGNSVLEYLGLSARFSGQALIDPLSNYKNKRLPRISNLRPAPLTAKAESLVLNHATCLFGVDDSETLALSSAFSFLDTDGNGAGDPLEPVGPFPVISQHRLGKGQVILISDPSIFINSMQSIDSNATLVENIATIAAGSLFIDQSHLPPSDLSQAQDLLARVRSYLSTPLGTSGLVTLALAITMMPVWRKHNQPSPKGDENDKT